MEAQRTQQAFTSALWALFTLGLMIAALATGGCSTGGYEAVQVDTLEEQILVAAGEQRAANRALQKQIILQQINLDDAQEVKDHLEDVRLKLDGATKALSVQNDPVLAESSYKEASSALSLALILLGESETRQ